MYINQDKGITAGLASGIFWGTPFVAPLILNHYTALDITFGRFVFFGLISLLYVKSSFKLFTSLNTSQKIRLLLLATTGFWLYTFTLSTGVQLTNGVVSALIAGSLPVVVAIFSRPKLSIKFFIGLISIIIGLIFLVLPDLLIQFSANNQSSQINLWGILVLLIALFMWSWFAIKNSQFLSANPHIKGIEYTSLVGIINAIMVIPIFLAQSNLNVLFSHSDILVYLICSIVLGVGASWVANIFWAYCSKSCPATIVGALIVSETLFGLLYSFIYELRLPHWNEVVAIFGLLTGVLLVIFSQRGKHV